MQSMFWPLTQKCTIVVMVRRASGDRSIMGIGQEQGEFHFTRDWNV